jgi:hypothetical protein
VIFPPVIPDAERKRGDPESRADQAVFIALDSGFAASGRAPEWQ